MKEPRHSLCFFCSLGCGLAISRGEAKVYYQPAAAHTLEFDHDNPINNGSLCGKCNYIFELFGHPGRVTGPLVRTAENVSHATWEEAISRSGATISGVVKKHGPGSVGILLGPDLTVEETEKILGLAKLIGTHNIDYCCIEDKLILSACQNSPHDVHDCGSPREIEEMETLFVVGDLFGTSPVLSKRFLKAKYAKRQNRLIVLESSNSHTSWFADLRLGANPGTEAMVLYGIIKLLSDSRPEASGFRSGLGPGQATPHSIDDIARISSVPVAQMQRAADIMAQDKKSIVALASIFGQYDRADLVACMCRALSAASESVFLAGLSGANSRGIFPALRSRTGAQRKTAPQIIEGAEDGTIKVIINFGVDIVGNFPGGIAAGALGKLEYLLSVSGFPNETTPLSHAVLPSALWLETSGTVINMFGMKQTLEPVLPPPNNVKPISDSIDLLSDCLKGYGLQPGGDKPAAKAENIKTEFELSVNELNLLIDKYKSQSVSGDTVIILPVSEFCHSGDGSLTRYLTWSRNNYPEPLAIVPGSSAGGMNGKRVRIKITSDGRETILTAKTGRRAREGVIIVPHHFGEIRRLFAWERIDGSNYLNVKPARVSVEQM